MQRVLEHRSDFQSTVSGPGSVRVIFSCGGKMFFYLRNFLFVSLLLFVIVSYSPDRDFGRSKC